MSHFARNQRRIDQISMSVPSKIPAKNPARYSLKSTNDLPTKLQEYKEKTEKDEELAEKFKQRLRDENERLGCQKTKSQLLSSLDAAEERRQAVLSEKVQKAKAANDHGHAKPEEDNVNPEESPVNSKENQTKTEEMKQQTEKDEKFAKSENNQAKPEEKELNAEDYMAKPEGYHAKLEKYHASYEGTHAKTEEEKLAEQFKQRLREENERFGSQKTKKQLQHDLDAHDARRQAILCEKVQKAKDIARHPHDRVAF